MEQRYENLGHSVGTFVRHLIKASISTRGLKVERYLDHCRMPFSPVFSYTDIENYLATVQTDIETLPPMSERHKAMQIIDGVEPPWFRDMIKKKHPWALLSENIDGPEGIITIIRTESTNEQSTLDNIKEGYGATSRCGSGDGDNGSGVIGGKGNDGNGNRTYTPVCYNCSGAHRVWEYTESCRRCDPTCGQLPSLCPRYISSIDDLHKR